MHLDQKDEAVSLEDTSAEIHICDNCQGEFIGTTQFLQHKETCNKKQVVVIMNEEQKQQDGIGDEEEATDSQMIDATDDVTSPPEEQDESDVPSLPQPIDFSNVQYDGRNESSPNSPDSRYPPSASNQSDSLSSQIQSDIVGQANPNKPNGVKSFTSSVGIIQEQLYTLHQQHLQQIQIILQIQDKIQALVAESFHHGVKSLVKEAPKTTSSHLTTIVKPPAVSTEEKVSLPHPIMPSSLEMLQSQVRQTSSLPFPAFPLPPPHPPFELFQQSQTGLQSVSSPLQVPPPLPYPGGLLQRKGKPPNVSVFDPKFTDDAFFRHKCHFCHKVFGSDSALQIHIRSHTGERPFKCNICGNRFSTKGNLKVHFQRHQLQYPNVDMDITPYPPSPTPHDQPLQPPSIDQIPMPGIPNESARPQSVEQTQVSKPLDLPNSPKNNDDVEINNNEKLPDIQKDGQLKESSSKVETTDVEEGDAGRPSSAPSKVLSSSYSPLDNELATSNDEIEPKEYISYGAERFKSSFLSLNGEDYKSSETSKLQHLVESIEQKITEPNQCVICHRVLSCKNALQLHYRIHTGERPFKCKVCGRTFTTKGNLKTHYGVHRAKPSFPICHECPICQKNFSNPVVLQQHLKLHAAEDMMIHSSFDSESYFREENQPMKQQDNLMESLQARFNFMKEPLTNGEGEKHDLTRPLEDADEVNAKRQKTSFDVNSITNGQLANNTKELPYHLSLAPIKPESDPIGESENSEIPPSPTAEEQQQMVDETNSISESALDLTPKVTSSSPDSVTNGPMYTTSSHLNNTRSESLDSAASSPDSEMDTKFFGSNEMQQIFDSGFPSFLMGRHRNRSNTTCYFCGKTFACASALNIHYRSHTKERPFKCDVCCKGFSTRGNLKQHMLTHKIRDMPSQLLGMNSPVMTSLAIGDENTTIPLESSQTTIDDPMLSKRMPSIRHQCHICEKQFQSDSALQIHVRTHTGEKPYKCHICGRAFTTKGNMKVHLGTHMWNGGSRRGRRITMDPPLMMGPKDTDLYRGDFFGFRPGFDYPFFHYPPPHPLLNGFNHLGKPNEISVIQNPHSLGMPYPPPSESSLKNRQSPTENASNHHSHTRSPGGSGRSSPDKKPYSPQSVVERPLASFPPSSHTYLHLARQSLGFNSLDRGSPGRSSPDKKPFSPKSEDERPSPSFPPSSQSYLHLARQSMGLIPSSDHSSPDIPSYMSSEESKKPVLTFNPSSKMGILNPLSGGSSALNYLHMAQSGDSKTYNSTAGYLSTGDRSPSGHGDQEVISKKEVRSVQDSLTSASRMVDKLQPQRV